jgi:hypothetical protein
MFLSMVSGIAELCSLQDSDSTSGIVEALEGDENHKNTLHIMEWLLNLKPQHLRTESSTTERSID